MGGHNHHRHGPYVNLCSDNCQPKPCSEDIYCGPNLAGSGINTGDSIVVALQKMDQVIFNNFGPLPTTTTTTTLGICVSYVYDITIYSCADCSFISIGSLGNSEPLTVGNYYNHGGNKILVNAFDICSGGDPVAFIPGNSGTATCAELVCPTTTTTTTL